MDAHDKHETAVRLSNKLNELEMTGLRFVADLILAPLDVLEKTILNGLVRQREEDKGSPASLKAGEHMAAYLGCFIRFRDDMIANHPKAKEMKRINDEVDEALKAMKP